MNFNVSILEAGVPITLSFPNDYDYQYLYFSENKSFYEGHYLQYIKRVAKLKKYNTCFDIGVCFGTHSVYFSRIMNCKVHAFEPNEDLFDVILENYRLNDTQCQLHKIALGDCETTGALELFDENAGRSSVTYDLSEGERVIHVMPLDMVMKRENLFVPDFIKIDVERHELQVLNGATELLSLSTSPDVFIEIDHDNRQVIFKLLESFGYKKIARFGHNFHFSKKLSTRELIKLKAYMVYSKAKKELGKLFK